MDLTKTFRRLVSPPPVVPVVRLSGTITADRAGLSQGLCIWTAAPLLAKAFAVSKAPCVALSINSPGGSPVQSALIAGRVRALSAETKKPVVAFVEDVAASGGYWLACAADEIVADPASVVGSIGVVAGGFGFDRAIERVGVDRRLYTSGTSKAMLDPFVPERREDVERLKAMLSDVHGQFIAMVKDRRGSKLKGDEADLFSGAFWPASRGLELGLVDRLGDLRSTMRERYGEDVVLKLIGRPRSWLWGGLRGQGPAGLVDPTAALAALEDRALWSRYGL